MVNKTLFWAQLSFFKSDTMELSSLRNLRFLSKSYLVVIWLVSKFCQRWFAKSLLNVKIIKKLLKMNRILWFLLNTLKFSKSMRLSPALWHNLNKKKSFLRWMKYRANTGLIMFFLISCAPLACRAQLLHGLFRNIWNSSSLCSTRCAQLQRFLWQ